MEWFTTANANLPASELQRHIRIETLPEWCAAPPAIAGDVDNHAVPKWEHWRVHREVIRAGLRFSLPGALHALQWTLIVGSHPRPGTVNLHFSMATPSLDTATLAALEKFVTDWQTGLEAGVKRLQLERAAKSAAVCESYASSGFG